MCEDCNATIANAGSYLDGLVEVGREAAQGFPEATNPQNAAMLGHMIRDSYLHNQGHESLELVCMGLSVAITRLIALEQIYGVSTP